MEAKETRRRAIAGATALLALGISVAGSVLTLTAPAEAYARTGFNAISSGAQTAGTVLLQVDLALVLVVGLLIGLRLPRHPIAWLLLALGATYAVGAATLGWMLHAFSPGAVLPGGSLAAWVYTLLDAPAFALIGAVFFFFPTGRPASKRWLRAFLAVLAIDAGAFLFLALVPGPLPMTAGVSNPVGLAGIGPQDEALLVSAYAVGVAGPPLVGAGSLLGRFRGASPIERLQLRWVMAAGALVPIVFFALMARAFLLGAGWDPASGQIEFASFTAMPVAIGIAILRYRLYAIDLIIRRTLVYGALTVSLGACYVVLVITLQGLLGGLAGLNGLAIAMATLVVAAAFRPLRRRVQDVIDRRFYRVRYDAERTMAALSVRVRAEVDVDAIETDLRAAVARTVGPTRVSVWRREPPGARSGAPVRHGRQSGRASP